MAAVLQRFLSIRAQKRPTPNPFAGNYDAHFTALCDLLRAFEELTGKPGGWSDSIIAAWERNIGLRDVDSEDSEYEYHIRTILHENRGDVTRLDDVRIRGEAGTLYVFQCGFLRAELAKLPGLLQTLPKNVHGFSNRLSTESFQSLRLPAGGGCTRVPETQEQRAVRRVFRAQ